MRSPLVVVVLVAAAGCHSAPRTPAPPRTMTTAPSARATRPSPAAATHPDRVLAREVLVAMNGFTDDACACRDASCVGAVQTRMSDWAAPRLARIQQVEPTDAENAAADALQVRMRGCLAQFTAPAMPLTGTLILEQLEEFTNEICACTDQACVAGAQERMLGWAVANLDAMKGIEPTEDQHATADRLDTELAECVQRLSSAAP